MSKGEGKKIAIKFTEDINIEENTINIPTYDTTYTGTASASATQTYAKNAFDGSTGNYWWLSGTSGWIKFELPQAENITRFKWYPYNAKPKNFTLSGSNDNVNWDILYSGQSENLGSWIEFEWQTSNSYKYFKWDFIDSWNNDIEIREITLGKTLQEVTSGNEDAFTITGQEYEYVDGPDNNGPLIPKTYAVDSVLSHPTELRSVLITFSGLFRNVVGPITIEYNQNLGNLSGDGGLVESFIESFTPTDLIPQPNPRVREYISMTSNVLLDFLPIEKIIPETTNEYISMTSEVLLDFIHVDDINP